MREIRLIATDLDGTLIGNGEGPEEYHEFRNLLRKLRGGWGTRWAVITGRHSAAAQEALPRLLIYGLSPDYLVLEDARIHKRNKRGGFSPYVWWNFGINRRRRALQRRYRLPLHGWRQELLNVFPNAQDMSVNGSDIWFRFDESAQAEQAADFLRQATVGHEGLLVFRWDREVYLAPVAGSKGEALSRLARELQLDPSTIFAVGDGANDISMLNGTAAGLPACVGNAAKEVRQVVQQCGGYQAREKGCRGVIESLSAFLDGAPAATASQRAPAPAGS